MNSVGKYLCLDWGQKRIGIAISDDTKKFAFTRDAILNNADTFNNILNIIQNEKVIRIIIGYPLNFKSEETHSTRGVELFAKRLFNTLKKYKLEIPIIFFDERLTSNLAKYNIINSDIKKSKRRKKELTDSAAAQIILSDYLKKLENFPQQNVSN
ncbi:MAG: Holliday junction resolvase RuvX [Ignavibacteria bacterium]